MQRYEFSDDESNKFWQIEQVGSELHISWGKVGTSGQSQIKDFDTEAKATAAKDKLVKEKTGKGYVAAGEAPMAAGATPKLKAEPKAKAVSEADDEDQEEGEKPASRAGNAKASGKAKVKRLAEEDGNGDADETRGAKRASATSAGDTSVKSGAAPAPAAPIASLQAPREAIEAWLTQRRESPSLDERALATMPRVLQAIIDTDDSKQYASLTSSQLQRGANIEPGAMHLVDTWLSNFGISRGIGGLQWINSRTRATAKAALALMQANGDALLAHLQSERRDAWLPLNAQEPGAAWDERFPKPNFFKDTSVAPWPLRSDDPHAKPSAHSATELWHLLRNGKLARFTASKSDPMFLDAIKLLADRLSQEGKTVPDLDSDQILLVGCTITYERHDMEGNLPNVIGYLIQAHGLAQFMRMAAACASMEVDNEYTGKRWVYGLKPGQGGHLFGAPSDTFFQVLRNWVLAADEADWQAAAQVAVELMPEFPESQRPLIGLLFAEAPEVAQAAIESLGNKLPHTAPWLLVALPVGDDARRLLSIKPDPEAYNGLYQSPAMLMLVLRKLGDEALSLLINGVDVPNIANMLAQTNAPDAILALAKQASAHKDNQARLKLALARWPLAGAVALARACAQDGKDTPLLLPMLRQTLAELGPALALVPAWLQPAARDLLAQLLAKQAVVVAAAPAEALPPVLSNPPWLQAKKRAAIKPMALDVLPQADAASGERPPLNQWEQKHLADAQATSKTDALALAEGLRIQNSWNNNDKGRNYLQALAVAIRQRDADALQAAWDAGVEEERAKQTHFYPQFNGLACVALPDELGLPLWNAKAGSLGNSWYHNHNAVLAHWGLAALPGFLRILRANPNSQFDEAMHWGSTEVAPIAARAAFKLKTLKKAGQRWLLRWPEHAMAGLIAPALGKAGEARDVAAKSLRFLAGKGHHEALMAMAARYDDPQVAKAVQAVLDEDPLDLYPSKIPALPALWQPQSWTRPTLKVGGALGDEAMTAFGQMMGFPRNDGLYEGLHQVIEACEPDTLAEFGWEMFSAWLADGAPAKDNWMFSSLAFLGNDEVARRLTPLIRAWPGEAAHARAVAGLDVLEGIGTDTALMLLNGIAQKVKFKGLQDKAREKIAAIAEARGLTTEELEDRLAPDLGLDERGALVLDFGPRQFKVGFDEALKPWVRDYTDGKDGARLKDLPKPIKNDDAEKTKEATERYKLLKKDAKTIAAQQIARLEIAMCQQRRWTAENFKDFIATHPLVRHIAQRLIWGVYAVDGVDDEGELQYPNFGGQLLACFRLAEDGSLTTADDEPYTLPSEVGEGKALRVGVPHALQLPAEDAQAFGQLFADYELLQPFAQVGRDTYALTDAEREAKTLTRWKDKKVPTGRILGLASKAWRKGEAQDGGGIWYYSKPLFDGRVIELNFDPGIIVGMVDEEPEQTLGELSYGLTSRWGGISNDDQLVWGGLDAISASELIRDMEALIAP